MSPLALPSFLRRLWALDTFPYSLRIFIALSTSMAVCWVHNEMALVMPLFLGTIACALSETDGNWRGRLRALLVTLLCFALAAVAVQLLFPHPWAFFTGMVLATFCLTMLGAIGPRYQAIAYGTLILSIYTTIGMDQRGGAGHAFWLEPALLLAGAAWYGLLSVLWSALFRHQPVQQNLAVLFRALGGYLRLKATLFEPVRGLDQEVKRLALAQRNGDVVKALNTAKESILSRMGSSLAASQNQRMQFYLRLYFIAQDVHERASSSHSPYSELTDTFFHSDVLFRCQRLLRLQGVACNGMAQSILLRQPLDLGPGSGQALLDLQAALTYLEAQQNPQWQRLLGTLAALARNLGTLEARLQSASRAEALDEKQDQSLLDRSPQSFREAVARVRLQLAPSTPLFRHAVRLSVALAAGYGLLHWVHARQGLLDFADHGVRLPAEFRRHAQTHGAARDRHHPRPHRGLGAVQAVPEPAAAVDVRGGGRRGVLQQSHAALCAGYRRDDAGGAAVLQPDRRRLRPDRAACGRHRARQPDRRAGGVPDPARLAGPAHARGGRPHHGRLRPVPARGDGAVPQRRRRQEGRPGLPHGAAQRPQRRRSAFQRADRHVPGAGLRAEPGRRGAAFPVAVAHAAELPVGAGPRTGRPCRATERTATTRRRSKPRPMWPRCWKPWPPAWRSAKPCRPRMRPRRS